MSNLIIVESPAKATTIKNFLGSGYKVMACQGHIRDLPKSELGVDIENDFEPKYINIRGKGPLIGELKKEAKKADKVFLASDPDREGEAISWHLQNVLGLDGKAGGRITFNEITKGAVKSAISSPRKIDMSLVDSQQTRRILDRIVGYKLSPVLWKSVQSGLSAGRVQSVATRLVVEREKEINAFKPDEYWIISASFETEKKKTFEAKFFGTEKTKKKLGDKENCDAVLASLKDAEYSVTAVETTTKRKNPNPPFTTSLLQQEAFNRLKFSSKQTMRVAQNLYEGAGHGHGLITYMRTDSMRISSEAQAEARKVIESKYGEKFYPEKPRVFKQKAQSQDAHEAIRPTDPKKTPDEMKGVLTTEQYKLYKLIWERFIASQMSNAVIDVQNVDVLATCADKKKYLFKSSGETVKFAGFQLVYGEMSDDETEKKKKLPEIRENEKLNLTELLPKQNFTQPPRRFTEATLVAALEEMGIGRPSTYAPTIETIIAREYISRDKKQLIPTKLGEVTNDIMEKHFGTIVDYKFTANLETELDKIAEGDIEYKKVLRDFYGEFERLLVKATEELDKAGKVTVPDEELDIACPKCGRKMVIKKGRFGKFAACPAYPECKTTMPLDKNGNVKTETSKEVKYVENMFCDVCHAPMVVKKGRYGEFFACSNYPKCRFTKQDKKTIGVTCPKCGGEVIEKRSRKRIFYGCSNYPKCDFSLWDEPINEKCPECGSILVKKKNGISCSSKTCKFTKAENK